MSFDQVVRDLDADECWLYLSREDVGRLATDAGGEIDIFPVNYFADGSSILIRTAPGAKLLALSTHAFVAFEVDAHTGDSAWSVVVKGHGREIETPSEIATAEHTPFTSWIPRLDYHYARIEPTSITGRTFLRLPESDRY